MNFLYDLICETNPQLAAKLDYEAIERTGDGELVVGDLGRPDGEREELSSA